MSKVSRYPFLIEKYRGLNFEQSISEFSDKNKIPKFEQQYIYLLQYVKHYNFT